MLGKRLILAAFAAAVAIAVAPRPAISQDKSITVFAAASMKNALDDADAAFTKQSGVKVVASYAASSALMKQIEQGAPADLFIFSIEEGEFFLEDTHLVKQKAERRIKPERVMKDGRWIDPASCPDSLRPLEPCDHEVLRGIEETA